MVIRVKNAIISKENFIYADIVCDYVHVYLKGLPKERPCLSISAKKRDEAESIIDEIYEKMKIKA